jgi:hypothetical protein
MTDTTYLHEAMFQTLYRSEGTPFIRLGLSRDGKLTTAPDEQFFFELAPGTSYETASQITDVLTRWVTHFGVSVQDGAATPANHPENPDTEGKLA